MVIQSLIANILFISYIRSQPYIFQPYFFFALCIIIENASFIIINELIALIALSYKYAHVTYLIFHIFNISVHYPTLPLFLL